MTETGEALNNVTSPLPTPEEVKTRLEFLKNLDIDVSSLKRRLPRYKKELSKDPDKASSIWGSMSRDLEESIRSWRIERLSIQMALISEGKAALEENGVQSEEFSMAYERVTAGIQGGDLEALDSQAKELVGILQRDLHRFNRVLLPQALYAFDKGIAAYLEMAKDHPVPKLSKKYYRRAWDSADKKEINDLLIYSNLLQNSTLAEIPEEIAKDRYNILKEKFSRIRDRVQEFQEFGIDADPIMRELARLDSTIEVKQFVEAESHLINLDKTVARLETEYLRRKGEVGLIESKGLLDSYGNLLDLEQFKERFSQLKDDEGKMSPNRFLDESQSLLQGLKENLFSNFNKQVEQRIQSLDAFIQQAPPGVETVIGPLTELRDRSRSYLMSGDITEAMENLALAESMLEHAEGELKLQELRESYTSMLGDMQRLIDENVDVAEVRGLIDEIEDMVLQDEIRPVVIRERIGRGESIIREKVTQIRRSSYGKERESVISLLSDIDTDDPRKNEIIGLMDSLEASLEDMNEDAFSEQRMGIRNIMDGLLTDHYRSNFSGMEEALSSSIGRLMEKGANVSILAESLENARSDYDNGLYLESGKALKNIQTDLISMERDFKQRTAEDRINSAEFLFEEARRSGVEVDGVTDGLQEAKRLLSDGMFTEALDIADRLETTVKGRWMEMRKDRLFGEILTLKDLAGDTQAFGVEFDGIRELIGQTETLFHDGRIEEANELVQKAREGLDSSRKQFFSESAMSAITEVKEDIKEASAIGVSTLEAETLLMEAERFFLNEEYEEAYKITLDIRQKLSGARDNHLRDEIPRKMKDISKKVERLDAMGLDTARAKDLLERSNVLMSEGRLDESLSQMSEARDMVEDLFSSQVSVTIPESIVEIRKEIDQAMGLGIEMEDISELLETAEEMFVKEDYEKALTRIGEVQQTLTKKRGDFLRDRFVSDIDSVEDLMNSTEGLDREIALSKENINMARDAFERGDYESSHALLERVANYIKESISDNEKNKLKNAVMAQYDEVKLLIDVARSENVDVTAEANVMKMALELIQSGELSQAEQVIQGAKKGVQDKRIEMKRDLIESSVQTTEIILGNMREMGMDVAVELSLMSQLKEALRRNDLDLCDQLNHTLEETLKRNRTPFTVQKVQKDISDLRGRVLEAESLSLDTRQPKALIGEAQTRYDSGDMEGAQAAVDKGNEILDAAFSQHMKVEIADLFKELDGKIGVMESSGIPFDDELTIKERCRTSFEEGALEPTSLWLNTAIIGANAKITSFQRASAEGWITQINGYLANLREMGLQIDDLEKILAEGISLHEAGNDDKAIVRFSSILDLGEDKRNKQQENYLRGIFQRLDRWAKDLVPLGMKSSQELSAIHNDLARSFQKGVFDPNLTEEYLNRMRNMLETESSRYMSALSKKHIEDAAKGYKGLKERGISDEALMDLTKEAGRKWKENDFLGANESAMDALDRIDKLSLEESEVDIRAKMTTARQMLTKLKSMGSNVENAETLYSKAEVALNGGKIKAANKILDSIGVSIKEILDRNLRESARESIEFTEAMIKYLTDNFSGISSKLAPAVEVLGKARAGYERKDFKEARSLANRSRELVEKVDHTNINQFLYVFRSSQASEFSADIDQRMAELSQRGIDVSKARSMLEQAEKHFKHDEFEKGRELIILDRILLGELESQSLKEMATSLINEAHVSIINASKKGLDTKAVTKVYDSAKEAFALKEYKKALLLAKKVSFQMKK